MNSRSLEPEIALVLLSGGQDSTVCLAWALERYAGVETIGFDYGQRHAIELDCREAVRAGIVADFPQWSDRLGQDHMVDISALGQISETSLTRDVEIQMNDNGLPNSFVPGRNLIFFVYAAALAYRRGIQVLVGGMCETDYSGYPDCRDKTLQVLSEAIRLGTETQMIIETPLMWLSKAQTWALTQSLGGNLLVDLVTEHTQSCYIGERKMRHLWGYGCGTCPACELRARGYEEWRLISPEAKNA